MSDDGDSALDSAAAPSSAAKGGTPVKAETQRNCRSPPLDDLKAGKTWQQRVQALVGPRGYENSMRRSFQSVILYEAKRIVSPLVNLRPNQKRLAFMHQARALLTSLEFIFPHQKEEIFWRTATSKEQMKPEIAWKRLTLIDKEIERLAKEIKPLLLEGRTHNEAVDMLVLDIFNKSNTDVQRKVPLQWEHAHNHVIMAFRLYYNGDHFDSSFPAPAAPTEIIVPTEAELRAQSFSSSTVVTIGGGKEAAAATGPTPGKSRANTASSEKHNAPVAIAPSDPPAATAISNRPAHSAYNKPPTQAQMAAAPASGAPHSAPNVNTHPYYQHHQQQHPHMSHHYPYQYGHTYPPPPQAVQSHAVAPQETSSFDNNNNHNSSANNDNNSNNKSSKPDPSEERRRLLQEVKDHLALLKELEDAISPEEIAQRKRELFAALPPAPPSQSAITTTTTTTKNGKRASTGSTYEAAAAAAAKKFKAEDSSV